MSDKDEAQKTAADSAIPAPHRPPCAWLGLGLSGKLLGLTLLFVMLAEVLIYVPSIANFRLNWLNDRLAAAHTAALVLDAAPSSMVPEELARQILDSIGARAVAMKMGHAAPHARGRRHAADHPSRDRYARHALVQRDLRRVLVDDRSA